MLIKVVHPLNIRQPFRRRIMEHRHRRAALNSLFQVQGLEVLVTIKAWRTLNSREVLRDRWISLRADDCVTADGLEISPYYVLDYPDWVHVVALDPLDRVLLIRQYRHGAGIVSVELPAGGVEPSDADILTAGARELAEEAGYGGRVSLVGVNSPNPANHSNRIHTVLARDIALMGAPQKIPFEKIEPFLSMSMRRSGLPPAAKWLRRSRSPPCCWD
jgi:8-oxo-dGTP pyrophosphatase MutT (NUDIX family)